MWKINEKRDIPKCPQTCPELEDKIKFVNRYLSPPNTEFDIEMIPTRINPIHGFHLLPIFGNIYRHASYTIDQSAVHAELMYILKYAEWIDVPKSEPMKYGPGYIFDKKREPQYVCDFVELVIDYAPNLVSLIEHTLQRYGEFAGFTDEEMIDLGRFWIAYYHPGSGVNPHIDNVYKSNGGPIMTLSIGSTSIYQDMIPLDNNKQSMRFEVPIGTAVILDEDARYDYAHALPFGYDYGDKIKFTLIFLFNKADDAIETGWSQKLQTPIMKNVRR